MFRPRDSHDQRLVDHRLVIDPEPVSLRWTQDVFGNSVTLARFSHRADRLTFESTLTIDHNEPPEIASIVAEHARTVPFGYDTDEMPDLLRSIERQMPDPGHVVDRWAHGFLAEHGLTGTMDLLAGMTKAIRHRFTYRARHTPRHPGSADPRCGSRLVRAGTSR